MTVSTGKPIWQTPAGDLGTIQEGKFYQLTLQAYDDSTNDASTLYYTMLAGELPEGIQCRKNGLIEGIPKAVSSLQGVPLEVGRDITSKFTVRVYTEDENEQPLRVADRTFSITVTGQDAPEWTTPAGSLGTFIDGQQVSLQLEYTDPDPDQTVSVNLLSGELPAGLTLSSSGVLGGVLLPVASLPDDALPGYDVTAFDKYPLDYATRSSSKNYQFTVEITDGYDSNIRTFEMFIYSRNDLTSDTSLWTADNAFLTADLGVERTPYLTTPSADLGRVRHDNFFAYKFDGVDTDGDAIEYSVTTGATLGYDADGAAFDAFAFDRGTLSLPPGLAIEPTTGWFYGYIPDQGLTETTYTFGLQVKKKDNPSIISPITYFTITIVGNIDTDVTWTQGTDLGTLKNGEVSKLYVEAVMASGAEVEYRIKTGSDSKLPQGLRLLSDGTIAGQVSFQSFTLDKGTTTFDESLGTRLVVDPTTFDRTNTFTVEAYNTERQISAFKTFKITIDLEYLQPYESLYIKAMPETEDRDILNQLLQNTEIFNNEWLYRPSDPNFGKSTSVEYQHAFGLKAASLDDYVDAVLLNHYRKNLSIGDIKVAQALDANDNVVYEVVYADIKGGMINDQGKSVSLAVTLDDGITIDNYPEDDSSFATVYPASLLNMQTRVIDRVGQYGEVLPDWMKSKQTDGRILGFTPAWVIAYAKPGFAKRIQYLIKERFTEKLNKVDFTIDRYIVDRRMTQFWNTTTKQFDVPDRITEFDGEAVGDNSTDRTIFDGDSTRFISKTDQYVDNDRLDKYVLYPKHNILGNKDYITNG
jgi:hypothetical protein